MLTSYFQAGLFKEWLAHYIKWSYINWGLPSEEFECFTNFMQGLLQPSLA